MSKSDYLEVKLLDWLFGKASFSPPDTYYVALYTSAPSDSGGGTEVSGTGYSRVAVANDAENWPATSGGVKANGETVDFGQAGSAWGTVTHFGLFDAASGGNLYRWGALVAPATVEEDDTVDFPPGSLQFTED